MKPVNRMQKIWYVTKTTSWLIRRAKRTEKVNAASPTCQKNCRQKNAMQVATRNVRGENLEELFQLIHLENCKAEGGHRGLFVIKDHFTSYSEEVPSTAQRTQLIPHSINLWHIESPYMPLFQI